MNASQARELGRRVGAFVEAGQIAEAYALVAPVLAERTPFATLGRIGEVLDAGPSGLRAAGGKGPELDAFLERIAADRTEGGWVVIGAALGRQLGRDPDGAFARCRAFVVAADIWYATDILGERVPGPALVADFQPSLARLAPWRHDPNRWVRRTAGVAVHFWAKRSRGAAEYAVQAQALLEFLEPMFEERDLDAVKGAGWGLKTLGRLYPELVAGWLAEQIVHRHRPHRSLMVRKALTYLSDEQRARATQFRLPKSSETSEV